MAYSAKIVADSIHHTRLTTMEITYPRFVHAEFLTHRQFSRNSASSRAIPIAKMIARVKSDPVWPTYWGVNEKGMQANTLMSEAEIERAKEQWQRAIDQACANASTLAHLGCHKQIANRLLEPFSWITTIVTATEWENFFHLRCNAAAQPEIRKIAEMMQALYRTSEPQVVKSWHLPYIQPSELTMIDQDQIELSVARCARVSYLTHQGTRDIDADFALFRRLYEGRHLSPFEHIAFPSSNGECRDSNFKGWFQYRKLIKNECYKGEENV